MAQPIYFFSFACLNGLKKLNGTAEKSIYQF